MEEIRESAGYGQFQRVLDTLDEGIWVTDRDDIVQYANPVLSRLLGPNGERLVGHRALGDSGEPALTQLRPSYLQARASLSPVEYEGVTVTAPGRSPALLSGSLIPLLSGGQFDGMVCTARIAIQIQRQAECTNHAGVEAEPQLARRTQELLALHQTSLEVNAQLDLSKLLEAIVERAAALLDTPIGGLYLLKPDGETLELVVSTHVPREYLGTTIRLGDGLAGRVAQAGKPLWVADYREWAGRAAVYPTFLFQRVMAVPVVVRGAVIGVIDVGDSERCGPFSSDEVRLLSLFADQAAVAVENARLYAQAQAEIAERKHTEAALAAERNMLRTLIDTVPDHICVKDTHSRFILANRAVAQYIGAESPEHMLGKTDFDYWPQTLAAGYFARERKILETGEPIVNDEEERSALDGEPCWFSTTKVPLRDPAGNIAGLVVVGRDITAQQSSDAQRERLLEDERQARLMADALRQAIAVLGSTLNFEEVLDVLLAQLENVLPYDAAQVMLIEDGTAHLLRSHGCRPLVTGDESASWRFDLSKLQNLKHMQETHQALVIPDLDQCSTWIRYPGEEWVKSWVGAPIEARGRVIGFLGLFSRQVGFFSSVDAQRLQVFAEQAALAIHNAQLYQQSQAEIVERMQTEAALAANQTFLNSVLDAIQDGITVLDEHLRIELVNHVQRRRFPSETSLVGRSCFEAFHERLEPCEVCPALKAMEQRRPAMELVALPHPDRSPEWFEVFAFPILDAGNIPTGVVEYSRDVTRRKLAEEATHRYAERLAVLYEIQRAILAAQSPEAMTRAVLERLPQLIPCEGAGATVLNSLTGQPRSWLTRAGGGGITEHQPAISTQDFGLVTSGRPEPAIVDDSRAATDPTSLDRLLAPHEFRGYLYAPMVVQEEWVGWLTAYSSQPGTFTNDHLAMANQVASSLAIAVRQAQLHEQTQRDAATKAGLLQEVNHRVRNNLSAIVGLLRLEQRQSRLGDAATYSDTVSGLVQRVQAMAAVHNLLSASGWSPVAFGQLVTQIVQTVTKTLPPQKSLSLSVNAPVVLLESDQAHHLALVIAELTTNATKYALGQRDQVSVCVQARQSGGWLEFEYRDDGPGYSESTLRMEGHQIGFQLIRKIVAQNLDGEVRLHNDGGAVALVRFRIKEGREGSH